MGRKSATSKRLTLSAKRVSRRQMGKRQANARRAALLLASGLGQVANLSTHEHIELQTTIKSDPEPEQIIQELRPEEILPSSSDAELDDQDIKEEQNTQANSDTGTRFKDPVRNGSDHNACREGRIEGRRIVDFSYIMDQMHEKFDHHNSIMGCAFRDLIQTQSRQYGLQTEIIFQCQKCEFQDSIWANRTGGDMTEINQCVVATSIAMGMGYTQLQEFLGSMNIPFMSPEMYRKTDMKIAALEQAALSEMVRKSHNAKK